MPTEITTSVGRIVWGHPTKSRPKTDNKTRQIILDAEGKPRQVWSFGVAFPKAEFIASIWPAMKAEVDTVYPNGPPGGFAWKYTDGDTNDREGKSYGQREGYAGCYVLAISSELMAPPIFKLNGGTYQQLGAEAIKCGDYVSVGLSFKANVPTDRTFTPGIYVNPLAVELVGYGQEIVSQGTADPMAVFRGAVHQLPPGATATPSTAPGAPAMPGMNASPPAPPPGPGMPGPGTMPPGAPPTVHAPPAPPPPVMQAPGMVRPTDPSHIAPDPQRPGAELWWTGTAWTPQPVMPPPAPDFVHAAPPPPPGMMPPPR